MSQRKWLNRSVVGIGLASLLSDLSHETATALLPAFLAGMGAAAGWLGIIEGLSDGLSSFAKLTSGYYTDRLKARKLIAVAGYVMTAVSTAAVGFATSAWHVLVARAAAWLGRGVRTPVRKALLASAVDERAYGRAFGFERMMDTLGAVIAPAAALVLLEVTDHRYPTVFALTIIPGLLAVFAIGYLVKEDQRAPVSYLSFGDRVRGLPPKFRTLLVGVGLFGLGDFAHTMLILLATQQLTSSLGAARAATVAIALYTLHNVLYAGFAFVAGWLADRMDKALLLAAGYFLAACMALAVMALPGNLWTLALVFVLGGIYVAIEEALEDSLCAELVTKEHHGMAFGTLATVNGVGDLVSSLVVGGLWSIWGTTTAFGYSAVLFGLGGLFVLRLSTFRL